MFVKGKMNKKLSKFIMVSLNVYTIAFIYEFLFRIVNNFMQITQLKKQLHETVLNCIDLTYTQIRKFVDHKSIRKHLKTTIQVSFCYFFFGILLAIFRFFLFFYVACCWLLIVFLISIFILKNENDDGAR